MEVESWSLMVKNLSEVMVTVTTPFQLWESKK